MRLCVENEINNHNSLAMQGFILVIIYYYLNDGKNIYLKFNLYKNY